MTFFTTSLSLFLCVLGLLLIASATADIDCNDDQYRNTLECWLNALQLSIPDQQFKDWKFSLKIHDMHCSELFLSHLTAETESTTTPTTSNTVHLNVEQVAATCHGKYHLTGGISGDLQVHVSELPGNAALQVAIELESSSDDILSPSRILTSSCQTHVAASSIHFTGSISAKLIQAFEKPIRHYIRDTLHQTICPLLPQQLDPLVNSYIQEFNHWKQRYLPTQHGEHNHNIAEPKLQRRRQLKDATTSHNPLEWAVPHTVLSFINEELEDHLQDGWLLFNSAHAQHCDQDCLAFTRGISGIIPQYDQQVSIPLHQTISLLKGQVQLFLPQVQISGIHQLQELQTTRIVTNHSVVVTLPNLELTIVKDKDQLTEVFDVALNITSLEATWDGLIQVVNWDHITLIQVIRAFEEYSNTHDLSSLSCILASIDSVELSDWVTKMVFKSLTVTPAKAGNDDTNALEQDLDHVITQVFQLVLDEYSQLWTLLSQGLIQGPARRFLNQWVKQWLEQHSSSTEKCPPSFPDKLLSMDRTATTTDKPWWIDFTKWKFLYQFNDLLLNHLAGLNHYLDCVQRTVQQLVQSELVLGSNGTANFYTNHWNTLTEFQVLQPQEATLLGTKVTLAGGSDSTKIPQATLSLEVGNATIIGSATINITLFASAKAQSSTKVEYNLNDLQNVSLANFMQHGQCGMVPTAELQVLPATGIEFSTLGVNVSIDVASSNTSVHLSTLDYDDVFVPKAVDWGVDFLRTWINKAMEEWSSLSLGTCPGAKTQHDDHQDSGKSNNDSWMRYPLVWVVLFVLVAGQAGVMWISQEQTRANEEALVEENADVECSLEEPLLQDSTELLMEPASMTLEEQSDAIDQAVLDDMKNLDESLLVDVREQMWEDQQGQEEQRIASEEDERPKCKALFKSDGVPEIVRFALPILVVGTIVLLVSSNLSVGASVNLSLRLGDEKHLHLPGLFQFSLANTITEFYRAGIYPLLFLVVVFSGIWPYAKLLLMLSAWLKPHASSSAREEQLLLLDALSKFSLVDTYVLVVMVVAFRFHLDVIESLGFDVFVNPEFGFYSFLLATCLSLLLGHGMLYFHRRESRYQQSDIPEDEMVLESILDHAFKVQANGSSLRLSRFFQVFLFSCCLVAMAFLQLGFGEPSFVFEIGGLAGMALGDKSKRTSYSLLSLGGAIPDSVENPDNFGILFLQSAYYFYAVATPIACLLCLTLLFICPMSLSRQKSLLVVAEIANAWSAVEVFVLSICAALLQISTFASFIIGDKCDLINKLMRELSKREDIVIPNMDDNPVCFTVQASVDPSNCWFLIVGVLLNSFVVSIGLQIAQAAVKERSNATRSYEATTVRDDRGKALTAKLFKIPFVRFIVYGSSAIQQHNDEDREENEAASAEASEEEPEWMHWF
jgi:hypothetical protein